MTATMTGSLTQVVSLYAIGVAPIGTCGTLLEAAAAAGVASKTAPPNHIMHAKISRVMGRTLQLLPLAFAGMVATYPNNSSMLLAGSGVIVIPTASALLENILLEQVEEVVVRMGTIASIVGTLLFIPVWIPTMNQENPPGLEPV
jgi:hypothetical protein